MDVPARSTRSAPGSTSAAVRGATAWAAVTVSLAAAAGVLVGLRAVAALEPTGFRFLLGLPALPRPEMDVAWSPDAVWPTELQALALERLGGVLVGLFLAACSVAVLNGLVLLFEAGMARTQEMAVRAAVGAGPRSLLATLIARVRTLLAGALAMGLALGLTAGAASRAAWPGSLEPLAALEAVAFVGPLLLGLAVTAGAVYGAVALRVSRASGLARPLQAGRRATADRREVFLRRALVVVQSGTAGAVALVALPLALSLGPAAPLVHGPEATVVQVSGPGGNAIPWADVSRSLADVPGLEAESLATPGALVGLGVQDVALTDCGPCIIGLMPVPLVPAVVFHHGVSPGYFEAAGQALEAGRDFSAADRPGAPRVAVVNRTLAEAAFHRGEAVGRRVRVGGELQAWYTVVGIVEDAREVALGGDDEPRGALYLSALQHPPAAGAVVLRGSEEGIVAAARVLRDAGLGPGDPVPMREHRARAAAPLVWVGRVAAGLGLLALALALYGARTSALQVERRRARDLAIRSALGASRARVARLVLRGAAGVGMATACLTLFLGTLFIGLLRQAAGGVSGLGPEVFLSVVGALTAATLAAAWRATREAMAVEPAELID